MENTTEKMTNAKVYFDQDNGPQNAGWVCETDEDGNPQFAMNAGRDASDAELLAEARSFADGEITLGERPEPLPSAKPIIDAITAGLKAGGDSEDWFAPEFETARDLTAAAGCVWDFDGWRSTRESLERGMLAGVRFAGWREY